METAELHPRRFFVVGLFAFLGAQQCYCWYSFASLPDAADFFGLDEHDGEAFSDLTMSWGPIAFGVAIGPAVWSLRRNGLRCQMRICAVFTFLVCLL